MYGQGSSRRLRRLSPGRERGPSLRSGHGAARGRDHDPLRSFPPARRGHHHATRRRRDGWHPCRGSRIIERRLRGPRDPPREGLPRPTTRTSHPGTRSRRLPDEANQRQAHVTPLAPCRGRRGGRGPHHRCRGSGWSAEEARLNFYNWDTYIGETTLDDFEAATGIAVKMDLFADNDELFAKLKEGNPGYDVIVPTNDYVERMITAGMLEPLDHSKVPNMANITPVFQDAAFDPGRKYSLPYMWGTIGIGYRKSKVSATPESWKHLYESDEYSGRIAMLGDGSTIVGIGLKYLGYSYNETDPARIKEVEELVIRQKPHIKAFPPRTTARTCSSRARSTSPWSGTGTSSRSWPRTTTSATAVPKEGGLLWEDTLAIPTGAPHPGERPRVHQLHPRRGGRRRDRRLHLLRDPQRGGKAGTCPRSTSRTPRSSRRRRWSRSRRRTSTWAKSTSGSSTRPGPASRPHDAPREAGPRPPRASGAGVRARNSRPIRTGQAPGSCSGGRCDSVNMR